MLAMEELLKLEEQGWQTLSAKREVAQAFYGSLLVDDALMVFPGGLRIAGKDQILDSIGTQPWQSFEIESPHLLQFAKHAQALIYRVTARREGSEPYEALISSVYTRREGRWKLALHQQTRA